MANITTLHGHSMFDISSMIQKSIRRGIERDAYYAANEMSRNYRGYLWKRLLTTSSEDCFDLLSSKLLELKKKDEESKDDRYIEEAVGYLLYARKNRDADYFACNLMNSYDKMPLVSIEPNLTEAGENQYPTKNGHSMFDCSAAMIKAIENANYAGLGYVVSELYWRYRVYLWKTLIKVAKKTDNEMLINEIDSLKEFDDSQMKSKNISSIFISKACVVLVKYYQYGADVFNTHRYTTQRLKDFDGVYIDVPRYVYDCHTYLGRKLGKTKKDFIVEEQNGLYPKTKGEFDNASWEKYFFLEKNGWYREDDVAPAPDQERKKELEYGTVQLKLF